MSVRVLIVDDSPTARRALRYALEEEDDLEVVGEVATGRDALESCRRLKPQLVTMDVFLEKESGLDVAAQLMREHPCPILVVTAADSNNPRLAFRALEAGALDVTAKLPHPGHSQYQERRRRLVRLVRTLAEVPVVRRRRGISEASPLSEPPGRLDQPPAIVLIGASTGGPSVVAQILKLLPRPFPVPIAIVQHMMNGFAEGHRAWLADATGHRTVICKRGERLEAGTVYLAPDDAHLCLRSATLIGSNEDEPRGHQRPAVDVLFESAARQLGSRAVGVLLTGMGRDGAQGMLALYEQGALTMVQAPETCAVDGMPRSALALGAVKHQEAPPALAEAIRAACHAK